MLLEDKKIVTYEALIFIVMWFIAALIGGLTGFFREPGGPPLRVGLFVLVPIVIFVSAYFLSPSFKRFAKSLNLEWMTMAHLWRFVGASFVYGYFAGVLPAQFALTAGIGDVLVAATAVPVALAIRRNSYHGRAAFLLWNILGLADLLLAITLGILYSESSFGILAAAVTTAPVTVFPGSLVPTFFVPFFILAHLLALSRSAEVSARSVGYVQLLTTYDIRRIV